MIVNRRYVAGDEFGPYEKPGTADMLRAVSMFIKKTIFSEFLAVCYSDEESR